MTSQPEPQPQPHRARAFALAPAPSLFPNLAQRPLAESQLTQVHTISKERWEELKPIIRRLYIDENRPFRHIAVHLRDNYGLVLTRRQFERRTAGWGFRKNTTKEQRRVLVQGDAQRTICTYGKVVSQSTRDRWVKEFDRELVIEQNGSDTVSPELSNDSRSESIPSHDSNPTSPDDSGFCSVGECLPDESWPWADIDVPGSPQLSRLFNALSLELQHSSAVEPLSLSEITSPQVREFISGSELLQVTRTEGVETGRAAGKVSESFVQEYISHDHLDQQAVKNPNQPMKYFGIDIIFPSGNYVSPNPFSELYPFPVVSNDDTLGHVIPISDSHMTSIKTQVDRLESYLATFGNIFPRGNSTILQSMEKLAGALSELKNFAESEKWWRRAVDLHAHLDGPNSPSPTAIYAMVQLFHSIHWQGGRVDEAKILEDKLQQLIPQSLPAEHDLATEFMDRKAFKLSSMDQYAEAEMIRRHILQIRLTHLGPRHTKTIDAISSLGFYMARKFIGDFHDDRENKRDSLPSTIALTFLPGASSSVMLSRTAVQLTRESGTVPDFRAPFQLIYTLNTMGNYTEALILGEETLKQCKSLLGDSHPKTLSCLAYLGKVYRKLGMFEKSVATLEGVLKTQALHNIGQDVVWRTEDLAQALQGLGRHWEAADCFETVFLGCISKLGSLNSETMNACWRLGNSLVRGGKHQSAIDHYSRHTKRIQVAGGDDHSFIAEVEEWTDEANVLWQRYRQS